MTSLLFSTVIDCFKFFAKQGVCFSCLRKAPLLLDLKMTKRFCLIFLNSGVTLSGLVSAEQCKELGDWKKFVGYLR